MIWKNRFCLASREKLLNSSVVRDCKAEGDSVLGLQMLASYHNGIFLSFLLFLLQTALRLQGQNLVLRTLKARAESGP